MEEKIPPDLMQNLFKLVKRLPNLRLKQTFVSGLTRSEYELLVILKMDFDAKGNAISISGIRSLLQITPAGVTHLINSLEEKGFIERLPDPADRRIVLIGLTDKGTETAGALITHVYEQLTGLIDHLGEKDSKAFIRLVSRTLEYFASQFEEKRGRGHHGD